MDDSRNKQLSVNLIAIIVQVALNYAISFFLTPYIVNNVGSEAHGFITLGNNLINYITIFTTALNSVVGRYVTISIHKGNKKQANEYFNSVLWANVLLAIIIVAGSAFVINYLEYFFTVPSYLVRDVKILFSLIVFNFVITIICNVFTIATFITNKLYISNIGNSIGICIKVIVLLILYGNYNATIIFVGVASLLNTFFVSIYNIVVNKKLNIGINIRLWSFSFAKIKELFFSGIWNSVTKLSQVLTDGLDMIMSNLFINVQAMGCLSVAYTVPSMIANVIGSITNIFAPQQTYYYAKEDTSEVVGQIKLNMKIMGFFVNIILVGFIIYGKEFFILWTPTQDIQLIYELAVISCCSMVITGVTSALNNVFLLTNHLKENSMVCILIGVFDCAVAFLLVRYTGAGVYAIAGVSKIVGAIVNITYIPLFASKCLNVSYKTFYPVICKYIFSTLVLLIVMGILHLVLCFMPISWVSLIVKIIINGGIVSIINYHILLNKNERVYLKNIVLKKLKL
ncbi:MAG: oligosaccharide flippase family protein [Eubacteriales bacterium]|nr:oligosaccharide flippase family protein [Eubacteriales bacterium]